MEPIPTKSATVANKLWQQEQERQLCRLGDERNENQESSGDCVPDNGLRRGIQPGRGGFGSVGKLTLSPELCPGHWGAL
jgi:hypothetical protein